MRMAQRRCRRLPAVLYCIGLSGALVCLWRYLGLEAKTVGHYLLAGWIVLAAVVLVAGLLVPVWEKAGQPLPRGQSKRGALP